MKDHGLGDGRSRDGEQSQHARSARDWVFGQMNTAAGFRRIGEVRTRVAAGLNYAIEF